MGMGGVGAPRGGERGLGVTSCGTVGGCRHRSERVGQAAGQDQGQVSYGSLCASLPCVRGMARNLTKV